MQREKNDRTKSYFERDKRFSSPGFLADIFFPTFLLLFSLDWLSERETTRSLT